MAWVRTSTSLITFGFTVYKFFQYVREQNVPTRESLIGARGYGLLMILIGLIGLAIATLQHVIDMQRLRKAYPEVPYSLVTVLAGLVALLGIAALVAVILRR
jgi:putative membrane protein